MEKNAIRKAREAAGLTQEQAAYRSGLSLRTIQNLEAGSDVRLRTLRKLAATYDTSVEALIPPEREAV
jgi:transcriptional regulator with XRE-family HTH domain